VPDVLPRADVLVVGANLLFLSKIQEAARSKGLIARPVPAAEVLALVSKGLLIMVDLERVGVEVAIPWVAAGSRVVGFASHGEVALLEAAAKAGLQALSKGQLASQLPNLVG
jgi:hypothetical protein